MSLPGGTLEFVSAILVQSAITNAIALAGGVSSARATVTKITETVTNCEVVVTDGSIPDVGACPLNEDFVPVWLFVVRVDLTTSALPARVPVART